MLSSLKFSSMVEFYEAFKIFDQNNNEKISWKELISVIKVVDPESLTMESLLGTKKEDKKKSKKYTKIQKDEERKKYGLTLIKEVEATDGVEDSEIDFSEFLSLMTSGTSVDLKKMLKSLFPIINVTSSGNISNSELKTFLQKLGIKKGVFNNHDFDEVVEEMIKVADLNQDNLLSPDEFEKQLHSIYKKFTGK